MLKLFLTPTSIVFEDLDDELFHHLQWKYGIEFIVDDGEYRVEGTPEQLYKMIYKLTHDYDIEVG